MKEKHLYAKEFTRWIADCQESVEWAVLSMWIDHCFILILWCSSSKISWEFYALLYSFFFYFLSFVISQFHSVCWLKYDRKVTVWRIDWAAAFDLDSFLFVFIRFFFNGFEFQPYQNDKAAHLSRLFHSWQSVSDWMLFKWMLAYNSIDLNWS